MPAKRNLLNYYSDNQIKVKRKSVEQVSPRDWFTRQQQLPGVDVSITGPIRRSKSRPVATPSSPSLYHKSIVEFKKTHDSINISPASSPEFDFFANAGHDLFNIEQAEPPTPSRLVIPATASPINPSSSIESSSQQSNDPPIVQSPPPARKRSSSLETTNLLNSFYNNPSSASRPNCSSYVDIGSTPPCKSFRGVKSSLFDRLVKCVERLNTDRSLWLYSRSSSEQQLRPANDNRPCQRLFVVRRLEDLTFTGDSCGGQVIFQVRNADSPPNPSDPLYVALPCSSSFDRQASDSPSLIGDRLRPNDLVTVYGPWLTTSFEGQSQLLYSFFWVELEFRSTRVDELESDPAVSVGDSCSLCCECLTTDCCEPELRHCPLRFKHDDAVNCDDTLLLDCPELAPSSGSNMPSLDPDCFLLLDDCQFWLFGAIRRIFFLLKPNVGFGIISPPSSAVEQLVIKPGSVYRITSLIDLPVERLPLELRVALIRRARDLVLLSPLLLGNASVVDTLLYWDPSPSTLIDIVHDQIATLPSSVDFVSMHRPDHDLSLPLTHIRCRVSGYVVVQPKQGSLMLSHVQSQFDHVGRGHLSLIKEATNLFSLLPHAPTISINRRRLLPVFCLPHSVTPSDIYRHRLLSNRPVIKTEDNSAGLLFVNLDNTLISSRNGDEIDYLLFDQFSSLSIDEDQCRRLRCNTVKSTPAWWFKQIGLAVVRLDDQLLSASEDTMNHLAENTVVYFSGIIRDVDSFRSHAWPICSRCQSASLTRRRSRDGQLLYQCGQCNCLSTAVIDCMEPVVRVAMSPNDDAQRGLDLIMSEDRLKRLISTSRNLTINEKTELNPSSLINQPIDNVWGLLVCKKPRCLIYELSVGTS